MRPYDYYRYGGKGNIEKALPLISYRFAIILSILNTFVTAQEREREREKERRKGLLEMRNHIRATDSRDQIDFVFFQMIQILALYLLHEDRVLL